MLFKLIAVVVVLILLYLAYKRFPPAPARISQTVAANDNQFDVFRDMEPADQTRENPWLGFLQEDVRVKRTGPIGEFIGADSNSGSAPLYMFESAGKTIDPNTIPSCKKINMDLSGMAPGTVKALQQTCEDDIAKATSSITYAVT